MGQLEAVQESIPLFIRSTNNLSLHWYLSRNKRVRSQGVQKEIDGLVVNRFTTDSTGPPSEFATGDR
jgi:hypothetical protein